MTRLHRLWTAWVDRLAHQEPATPMALFRIIMGWTGVVTLVDMIHTDTVNAIWLHINHGGIQPLTPNNWLIDLLGGPRPEAVWPLVWAALLLSSFLVIGLGGRITAFVSLQAWIALFALDPTSGGGHDRLLLNGLWLLVLAPATRTLSLDCRLRNGRWRDHTPVAAWPRYLAICQLVLLYSTTSVQKLGAEWFPWGDYEAIYLSLLLPSWSRFDLSGLLPVLFPLTQLATAMTWLWEISWPMVLLALYFRATRDQGGCLRAWCNSHNVRNLYVAMGLAIHGFIWATMNLGPFSLVTLGFYPALFHHDEFVALNRWIRRRYGFKRNTEPLAKSAT